MDQIAPALCRGNSSDVGSARAMWIGCRPVPQVHFIPGHPLAGTEHSPAAGFAELSRTAGAS